MWKGSFPLPAATVAAGGKRCNPRTCACRAPRSRRNASTPAEKECAGPPRRPSRDRDDLAPGHLPVQHRRLGADELSNVHGRPSLEASRRACGDSESLERPGILLAPFAPTPGARSCGKRLVGMAKRAPASAGPWPIPRPDPGHGAKLVISGERQGAGKLEGAADADGRAPLERLALESGDRPQVA